MSVPLEFKPEARGQRLPSPKAQLKTQALQWSPREVVPLPPLPSPSPTGGLG